MSDGPPLAPAATPPAPACLVARACVLLVLLLAAGVLVGAVWLMWLAQSTPGVGAAPVLNASAESPGSVVAVEALRREVARNPRNGRAWALLGYAELEAERYTEAATAFDKAVAVSPKVAADPGVWCDWADALGMAQGGSLKGRPEELVAHALALQPAHPKALDMAGSAAYERREFGLAVEYWRRLLPQLAATSTRYRELESAITRAERLAATSLPAAR